MVKAAGLAGGGRFVPFFPTTFLGSMVAALPVEAECACDSNFSRYGRYIHSYLDKIKSPIYGPREY
jgi:hypothetical protein